MKRDLIGGMTKQQLVIVSATTAGMLAATFLLVWTLWQAPLSIIEHRSQREADIGINLIRDELSEREAQVLKLAKEWRAQSLGDDNRLAELMWSAVEPRGKNPSEFIALSVYDFRETNATNPPIVHLQGPKDEKNQPQLNKMILGAIDSPYHNLEENSALWLIPEGIQNPVRLYLLTPLGNHHFLVATYPFEERMEGLVNAIADDEYKLKIMLDLNPLVVSDGWSDFESDYDISTPFEVGNSNNLEMGLNIATIRRPSESVIHWITFGVALIGTIGGIVVCALLASWFRTRNHLFDSYLAHRSLFDNLPVLALYVDPDLVVIESNPTAQEVLAFTEEELRDRNFERRIARMSPLLLQDMKDEECPDLIYHENSFFTSGRNESIDVNVTAVREELSGGRYRWLIMAQDISKQVQSERAKARSQLQVKFLSQVVETLDDGLLAIDHAGRILYANPAALHLIDPNKKGVMMFKLPDVFRMPRDSRVWASILRAVDRGAAWQQQFGLRCEDSDELRVSLRLGGVSKRRHGRAVILILRDLTRENYLTRELATSQRKYQVIFDQAPSGIIVLNDRGVVADSNAFHRQKLAKVLNLGAEDTENSIFKNPNFTSPKVKHYFENLYKGEPLYIEAFPVRNKELNLRRILTIKGIPDVDAKGKVKRSYLFIEDITERYHLEQERRQRTLSLEDEKQRAVEANRLKSQFIATISHELRTPLNAIIGFSQIIARKSSHVLEERQMANLDKIKDCGEQLLRLVNDLLDISKIEADHLEIRYESISINAFFEGVRENAEPLMERNDNRLTMDFPPEMGNIETDPFRLQQIMTNLLGNAAKFTHGGQVIVTAESHMPDSKNAVEMLDFIVQDSGVGISKEQCEAIFEEFYQADGSATRQYGGTGLGLSISRRLARAMGGDIIVESEIGVGSTFTVRLPRTQPKGTGTKVIVPSKKTKKPSTVFGKM